MAEKKIYTKEDIPENGFTLTQKQKNSILELQDQFYIAVDNEHAQGVANALDGFSTKSLLFLERNLGAMISLDDSQSANNLVGILKSRVEVSLYDSTYRHGFSTMKGVFAKYHSIATGRSIETEDDQRQNFEEHVDQFFDDFSKIWDHFEEWFESDLYITQSDWEKRQRHGVFAELFLSELSITEIEEGIQALNDEDLDKISTKSILQYVDILRSEAEYEKAEFLLHKFGEKFSRTKEDLYNFHYLGAYLKLDQNRMDEALQEFQMALNATEFYGQWDYRYTQVMGEIFKLKARLNIQIDDENLTEYEHRAKLYSHETLLRWCEFLFLKEFHGSELTSTEPLDAHINQLFSEGIDFVLPPRYQIRFLFWVDAFLVETSSNNLDLHEARVMLLNQIIKIAEEFSRWSALMRANESLIQINEEKQNNKFRVRELKKNLSSANEEIEFLDEMYKLAKRSINRKTPDRKQTVDDYFQHCTDQNNTEAIEKLIDLPYWFSEATTAYGLLDNYNGAFIKLIRQIEYMNGVMFRRKTNRRYGSGDVHSFRGKVLDSAFEAGGPWAEARALGAVLDAPPKKFYKSAEARLKDIDRILELQKEMGAKKLAAIYKQKKAEQLEFIGQKKKSRQVYEEAISELLHIEPLTAFYTYSNMVRKQKLCVTQPDDVIERCEIIKSQIEFNQFDRMEFDCIQAFALVCKRGRENLREARKLIQPSFETVMLKPYVNQRNASKYGSVISTYLMIDILEHGVIDEGLIKQIESTGHFNPYRALYYAWLPLMNIVHFEEYRVLEKMEIIIHHINDGGLVHQALELLNFISKQHHHNGDIDSAHDVLERIILLGSQTQKTAHITNAIYHFSIPERLDEFLERSGVLNSIELMESSRGKLSIFIGLGKKSATGLHYLQRGLEIAQEIGARKEIATALNEIAYLTKKSDDIVHAVEFVTDHDANYPPRRIRLIAGMYTYHNKDIELPQERVSLLIDTLLRSNVRFVDTIDEDSLLKATNCVAILMDIHGNEDVKWRETILTKVRSFVEEIKDTDFYSQGCLFEVFITQKHAEIFIKNQSFGQTSKGFDLVLLDWLKAIEKAGKELPGYQRKSINSFSNVLEQYMSVDVQKSRDISDKLIDYLTEKEGEFDQHHKLESGLQKAEICEVFLNPEGMVDTLVQLSNWMCEDWKYHPKKDLTDELLRLFVAGFQNDSTDKNILTSSFFKVISSKIYIRRYRNKKGQQFIQNIVAKNLQLFLDARSPFMPTELEQIVIQMSNEQQKNEFEPENVLAKFLSKDARNSLVDEAIDFHFKNKSAPNFISNLIDLSAGMVPTNKERHEILVSFFSTIYAWNKGEGKTKADVLRSEKIEDKLNSAIVESIETDDSLDETERKTLLVQQASRAVNIERLRKASEKYLIESICEESQSNENPQDPLSIRDQTYLTWMTKIVGARGDGKKFKQLRAGLMLSPNPLFLLGKYARIAHSRGYKALPKKLYHDILTLPDCTDKRESYTYYRLACLEENYNQGKQGLMEFISEKENEGHNAWIDRLLLCMYMIKHEGVSRGVEAIARRALRADNVKILVGDEVETLELGDLKIGEKTYECSPLLRERFATRKNQAIKSYMSGSGNGNDIAFLCLDGDGVIIKFQTLNSKPHIEVVAKGS